MGRKSARQTPAGIGVAVLAVIVVCGLLASRGTSARQTSPATNSTESLPPTEKRTRTLWVSTTNDPLSLRANPSSTAPVLAMIPRAAQVESSGASSGQFTEISYDGHQGWAASQYLSGDAVPDAVVPIERASAPGPFIPYKGNGGGPTTCADGTRSHSSGRGTCSHHGGIR